jgi:hypothetical protein
MTEIDVVKKGSRTWLWVLMIIALALVLWFMFAGGNTRSGSLLEEGRQPHLAAAFAAAQPLITGGTNPAPDGSAPPQQR